MTTHEFLTSVTIIVMTMGIIALLERVVPLFTAPAAGQGRRRANLVLTALTLLFSWALTSVAALIALTLSLQRPGIMARLGAPPAIQLALSVVVLDFFFGYLAHRTMHMSAALWRVHRVHHSDPFVDVTTTYRTHPLEVLWRFVFMIVPVWLMGIPAEAVVIYRLLSAINGTLEHANIRLWPRLDSALSLVWVTPNMHKVHHSRFQVETDSNYGNIVSVYDHAFGTFTPTGRGAAVTYGLEDTDPASIGVFGALLSMPFRTHASGSSPYTSEVAA